MFLSVGRSEQRSQQGGGADGRPSLAHCDPVHRHDNLAFVRTVWKRQTVGGAAWLLSKGR